MKPQDNETIFTQRGSEPLAARMRPATLEEYVGQEDILGPGKLLRRAIEADQLSSLILWGPPGSGKTTLGHVIARRTDSQFLTINAVLAGVKDIRQAVATAKTDWTDDKRRSILFIDEVHRFNKAQQDALLPYVENGTIILIGATTENPYFEVNKPLVSRSRIFELKPLGQDHIAQILRQALADEARGYGSLNVDITDDALAHLSDVAQGDARSALNALELAVETTAPDDHDVITIDMAVAEESIQRRALLYDKDGDVHYDAISAFIKSMRGSDPDAALYWMSRMLYSGEDPRFIARRMIIFASEDVGMADPMALQVATVAARAVEFVGMPECQFNLSQACIHLATAEKSNSAMAYFDALKAVEKQGVDQVPNHLKDANRDKKGLGHGQGYKYPHAYRDHWTPQQYLPDQLEGMYFYHPSDQGYEEGVKTRMSALRQKKAQGFKPEKRRGPSQRKPWFAWQKSVHAPPLIQARDRVLAPLSLPQDGAVLDLGPAGIMGWAVLEKVPLGRVVCLLNGNAGVQTFEEKRRLWRVDKILSSMTGEPGDLSLSPDSFDVVLGLNPLARTQDATALLALVARVLKPGGRLCFGESLPARRKRLWQALNLDALPPDLTERVIAAEEALYAPDTGGMFGLDETALTEWLTESGFEVLAMDLHQEEEVIAMTEDLLTSLFGPGKTGDRPTYGDRLRKLVSDDEFEQVTALVRKQLSGKRLNRQSVSAVVSAAKAALTVEDG